MIDFHSHVLPGVDDGATSVDMAKTMLDHYSKLGYETVVATPHWSDSQNDDCETAIDHAYPALVSHARERNIQLLLGRECLLSPALPQRIYHAEHLTISDENVILVELPFTSWPLFTDNVLFELQARGLIVVLAHPERYHAIQQQPTLGRQLAERGIIFQLTIGSFTGSMGRGAKACAEDLLRSGLVHIVATDAHSPGSRMGSVSAGLDRLRDLVGSASLEQLTQVAPRMLLQGDVPSALPFRRRGRRSLLPWRKTR